MNRFTHYLTGISLSVMVSTTFALPPTLTIHNTTDLESEAYINGNIATHLPSKPRADNIVPWIVVQMACYGRTVNDICSAMIKMASNTATPLDVGMVYLNMKTGQISPEQVSGNGYTFTSNKIGEATLSKNAG